MKKGDEGYFLKDDVQYPKKLHELHNDLQFLSERMLKKKVAKLVTNLHGKTEYVIQVHRVIKFNQNTWLKPYIIWIPS